MNRTAHDAGPWALVGAVVACCSISVLAAGAVTVTAVVLGASIVAVLAGVTGAVLLWRARHARHTCEGVRKA
jgi:hypothetical protein